MATLLATTNINNCSDGSEGSNGNDKQQQGQITINCRSATMQAARQWK